MKTSLAFPLAITFALVMTGCSSRQAGDLTSEPVVPLVMNDHQASMTFRTIGGEGDHPVSYTYGYANAGFQSAGDRVYDSAYFKRIPAYLKKIAGGTDSISQLVEADKTVYVEGEVKAKSFTLNGIPMPTPFDKEQPAAQQFTPHAKKNYLVETVIADTWVMSVYEVSTTGERKTIGVRKVDSAAN
ncbi:hypothetical protein [Pseudomonas sp. BC115LW]|uniref:hypothetical protein n=1 Tax=Pseudomonas sp. BC115LW TaxID=2683267 RepID=UPI001412B996|nr:hypothetical protein [Pseudomonas sp. BC115LW]NBB36686.1 hypothetical protein [Pseudomonas sp. BC115LW]